MKTTAFSSVRKDKIQYLQMLLALFVLTIFSNCTQIITNPTKPEVTMVDRAYAYVYGTKVKWGGVVASDGGLDVTARGVCWDTLPMPRVTGYRTTDGSGPGSFSSTITGLLPNKRYFLTPYAINSLGTTYGYGLYVITGTKDEFPDPVFNTNLTYGTVTDVEGNVYKTVQIGTQTWMAENLKVTKYRNGESISNVTDNMIWYKLTDGAYCWYNNDAETYKSAFGALYNWYAVNDPRKIAPEGWHVPTMDEWKTLLTYLGNNGGKMKESGLTHWSTPNTGTNTSGFTALPGGFLYSNIFTGIEGTAVWWSSTEYFTTQSTQQAWSLQIWNFRDQISSGYGGMKISGFGVRCIKD
jgi:uncharacterized protein (TIGR02145 family)